MQQKIGLLLADDHTLFRQGLRRIFELEDDIAIVGECSDGEAAIEQSLNLKPEVVLMDINMPKKTGVDATRYIKEADPSI